MLQTKEIYKDGVLIEKHTYRKGKSALQLITLGLMLLSVFVTVSSKTIMQYYTIELPCWFWIVEAISPIVCMAIFAIYEVIRD